MQTRDRLFTLVARRRRTAGVTLVEVLIVIAIMAMLSGGVAFALLPRMKEAQLKTAKQGAQEMRKVAQLYMYENAGECPSVSQLRKSGHLDKGSNVKDPWDEAYRIRCGDDEVFVESSGPDKKRGTEDDIVVPNEGPADDDS